MKKPIETGFTSFQRSIASAISCIVVVVLSSSNALGQGIPIFRAGPQVDGGIEIGKGLLSAAIVQVQQHLLQLSASWVSMPAKFLRLNTVVSAELISEGWLNLALLGALFFLLGFAAAALAWWLTRPLRRLSTIQQYQTPVGRLRRFGGELLAEMLIVSSFTMGSAASFFFVGWPPVVREITLVSLTAGLMIYTYRSVARTGLVPQSTNVIDARELRAFDISDDSASHWYRWTSAFVDVFAIALSMLTLLTIFDFNFFDVLALAVPFDIVLLAVALLALWRRPHSARAVESQRIHIRPTAINWIMTGYFIILFLLRTGGALAMFWTAVVAVGLPLSIFIIRHSVRYVFRQNGQSGEVAPIVGIAVADRAIRLALITAGAFGLARIWDLDISSLGDQDGSKSSLFRGLLDAILILLAADFGWSIVKAIIQRELGLHAPASIEGELVLQQHTRVRTLLPIIQNILFAVFLILSSLMILASMGVQIGPLVAGAGVIGVAVGFGAQTLVKDVISGIFYLFDDAFRVGEYISSGKYMGTVESFSLRSVKLRHHRGSLFTVPFGELGAVQNQSRDWTTDKFNITVRYETDIEVARKLIKTLGQELAEDPEFAPWVIEPIKMQGVQEFGDHGIVLRIKYTTRPGGALGMKRRFYVRLREAFKAANIELPAAPIQMQTVTAQPAPQPSVASSERGT